MGDTEGARNFKMRMEAIYLDLTANPTRDPQLVLLALSEILRLDLQERAETLTALTLQMMLKSLVESVRAESEGTPLERLRDVASY